MSASHVRVDGGVALGSIFSTNVAELQGVSPGTLSKNIAYVSTFKRYFGWDAASTLTHNGTTIIQPATLPAAGRWIDMGFVHPYWATQATHYVDSVSGNDENDGSTSPLALKTWAELRRRLNDAVLSQNTTVWVVSALAASDPIELEVRLRSTMLNIRGVRTVVRSSVFTSPAVPVPSTSTKAQLTDASVPGGSWTADVNYFLQDVSASKGVWVESDAGANVANTSYPYSFSAGASSTTFAATTLTTGNAYQIQSFPQVTWGRVDALHVGNSSARSRVVVDGLNISGVLQRSSPSSTVHAGFYECKFVDSVFQTDIPIQNCCGIANVSTQPGCAGVITGGLFRGGVTVDTSVGARIVNVLSVGTSGISCAYSNVLVQGVGVFGCSSNAFNVTFLSNLLINGHVYGTGNTGYGLNIGPGCNVTVSASATCVVSGTSGDLKIGLSGSAVSLNPA